MKDTFRKLQDLSTNGFSSQVSTLRHLFGFSKKEFAEALGVKRTTIVRWESGTEQLDLQDRHIELIDALRMIAENLDQLFEPRMIKVWAERPNPALGGERPKDFAKKPGGVIVMAHLLGSLGREP